MKTVKQTVKTCKKNKNNCKQLFQKNMKQTVREKLNNCRHIVKQNYKN